MCDEHERRRRRTLLSGGSTNVAALAMFDINLAVPGPYVFLRHLPLLSDACPLTSVPANHELQSVLLHFEVFVIRHRFG